VSAIPAAAPEIKIFHTKYLRFRNFNEKPSTKKQTLRVMVLSDKAVEFGKIIEGEKPIVDNLKNYILPIIITNEPLTNPSFVSYEKPFKEIVGNTTKATLSCRVRQSDTIGAKMAEEEPDDEPIVIVDDDN
jgi:hypothetical protein